MVLVDVVVVLVDVTVVAGEVKQIDAGEAAEKVNVRC